MKSNKLAVLGLGLTAASFVYAGTMGPAVVPSYRVFVLAEGGYTENSINGINVNILNQGGIVTQKSEHGGTGRGAAGMLFPLNPVLDLSSEIGWGYYGSTDVTPVFTGLLSQATATVDIQNKINGMDLLVGLVYKQPWSNAFLKVGGLIQNHETDLNLNLPSLIALNLKNNMTQVLPEIKVGASYLVNDNWSVSFSYMHAFGSDEGITINVNSALSTASIDRRNPTLDTVLGSVQYTFN